MSKPKAADRRLLRQEQPEKNAMHKWVHCLEPYILMHGGYTPSTIAGVSAWCDNPSLGITNSWLLEPPLPVRSIWGMRHLSAMH